jgi:hypothetical protein
MPIVTRRGNIIKPIAVSTESCEAAFVEIEARSGMAGSLAVAPADNIAKSEFLALCKYQNYTLNKV